MPNEDIVLRRVPLLTVLSLTCRKRRVKCDEGRPRCGHCNRSDRNCTYAQTATSHSSTSSHPPGGQASPSAALVDVSFQVPEPSKAAQVEITSTWEHLLAEDNHHHLSSNAPDASLPSINEYDLSPLAQTATLSPSGAPFEWYDLLARDAISNIQKHNLSSSGRAWNFDESSLSRRHTPVPEDSERPQTHLSSESPVGQHGAIHEPSPSEPWNTATRININGNELVLFQHYARVVGPILDLFDPDRHFSNFVPHLAVHNVGLLKSLLAVAARHMSLHGGAPQLQQFDANNQAHIQTPASTLSSHTTESEMSQMATQYYYETLQYLSQTLLYPSYTRSLEILATAIMISTYEMFDSNGSSNNGDWERHLQGAFWIQRSQDNNGESADGLRKAVWWAWVRQDIWAAFRENRHTLTFWQPKKKLADLNGDELATRIVYIAAKCVAFAASTKEDDIVAHIEQGSELLQALEDWYRILPSSYQPISTSASDFDPNNPVYDIFSPIWIHPPSYAAAIQTYHFARIVVLLHQPSTGGLVAYRNRQKMLGESVDTVCGIAMAEQANELPSAFVNIQALFAGEKALVIIVTFSSLGTITDQRDSGALYSNT